MNNPTIIATATAVFFGALSTGACYFYYQLNQKYKEKTNEFASLFLKWQALVLESNTLGADLQKLARLLVREGARSSLHVWLSNQDDRGEKCILSKEEENSFRLLKPILIQVYTLHFERDFGLLSSPDSLRALINLPTKWLFGLESYSAQHPELKEKSMSILHSSITNAGTYHELKVIIKTAMEWPPFQLWKDEITLTVHAKAFELSKDDVISLQGAITKNTGSIGSDGSKFRDVSDVLSMVLDVFTRELIAENDANELKTKLKNPCVDTSLKYLRHHATNAERAAMLAQLTEKCELLYNNTITETESSNKTEVAVSG